MSNLKDMDSIKILAIITARGGSKGIPGKNIKLLAGKPLLAYTIEAAHGSKLLTRTILSTDDEKIAAVGKQFEVDIPFMRPAELAQDQSKSIDVVQHALRWLKNNEGAEYDYLLILQPTSPCRTAEDIDACIQLAADTGADSVISEMIIPNFVPQKIHRIIDGRIQPYFPDQPEGAMPVRRQDLPQAYRRNAAIFLTKVSWIMKNNLFGDDSRAYLMPLERSVDIDDPIDFELAEFWVKRLRQ